jgi:hypothetical protein
VDRLLEMREAAEGRLRLVDRDIHAERRVSHPFHPSCDDPALKEWRDR